MNPSVTAPPLADIRYLTLAHRWGTAALAAAQGGLCAVSLLGGRRGLARFFGKIPGRRLIPVRGDDPHLDPARAWLDALLSQGRYDAPKFTLAPPPGTKFQELVWRAVTEIPRGETRTYAGIARAIGSPGAARAVGAANARNPLPPIIPCHRLVGADGGHKNYAGGLAMKRWLLEAERFS